LPDLSSTLTLSLLATCMLQYPFVSLDGVCAWYPMREILQDLVLSLSHTPLCLIRPQPQQQATLAQQADPTLQCLKLGLSELTLFSQAPVPQAGLDRKEKGEIGSVTASLDYPLRPWSNQSNPSSL
jgi:hypothetical protein